MGGKVKLPVQLEGKKPMHFRYVDRDYFMWKVNSLGIKSARQYWKWFEEFKPAGFPKRPDRTYIDAWNVLLKTDNVYLANAKYSVRSGVLLPYYDAISLIHPLQLGTAREYHELFDNNKIPDGIPRRPDVRYLNFKKAGGWGGFLGKTAVDKIKAAANIKPLLILYRNNGQSPNILNILIYKKGQKSMMNMIREKGIDVVKVYYWYNDFSQHIFDILDSLGTKQGETSWMFSNLNGLYWELESVLEVFNG